MSLVQFTEPFTILVLGEKGIPGDAEFKGKVGVAKYQIKVAAIGVYNGSVDRGLTKLVLDDVIDYFVIDLVDELQLVFDPGEYRVIGMVIVKRVRDRIGR